MQERMRKFVEKYGGRPLTAADAAMLAPDFEAKRNQFKEFYATQYPTLRAAEKTFRNLLQLLLIDLAIDEPKLASRLKERDECVKKFELKYRHEVERKGQDYEIRTFITDLIGVRVICLYETDIEKVEKVIRGNFEVLSVTDKTQTLTEDVSSFGYKGVHLDVKLKLDRASFPEYSRFGDIQFEVQIRSIVQDAWSEVDHKLKYKRQIPDALKRRIIRLAALFELADQEFVAVKEETNRLEIASAAPTAVEEAEKREETLDAFSFLSFMQQRYPGYTFDPIKVDGFVDEIKQMKRNLTVKEFVEAVAQYGGTIKKYREKMLSEGLLRSLNPFTEIRHVLYAHDPNSFDDMLYPLQRDNFLSWYNEFEDYFDEPANINLPEAPPAFVTNKIG